VRDIDIIVFAQNEERRAKIDWQLTNFAPARMSLSKTKKFAKRTTRKIKLVRKAHLFFVRKANLNSLGWLAAGRRLENSA
jgi:hypothetical protein